MNRWTAVHLMIVTAIALSIVPIAGTADIELGDTCTLADAIKAANADAVVGDCPTGDGTDTITLSSDITLDAALPHITSEVTIEGGGFTISGDKAFRIFYVRAGALTVKDLIMTEGVADMLPEEVVHRRLDEPPIAGGAIVNLGSLTVTDSTFTDNLANYGAAIYNSHSEANIKNTTFKSNHAFVAGGSLYDYESVLRVAASVFDSNTADNSGGAIAGFHSEEHITGSNFTGNSAYEGGAIDSYSGALAVTSSTFTGNRSERHGGAIYTYYTESAIAYSEFTENHAQLYGGGIFNRYDEAHISSSLFASNSASRGGAIRNLQHNTSITDSIFRDHHASRDGGAIHSDHGGVSSITNSVFSGNNADDNGGAIWQAGTELILTNSTLSDNTSDNGAALFIRTAPLRITNSTLFGNHSHEHGGGIYFVFGGNLSNSATLTHATIVDNSATEGGGLYVSDEQYKAKIVHLRNTIIVGNTGGDCFSELHRNASSFIADGTCSAPLMGDPMLADLVDPADGSPPYYPLLEGSPAIDAADHEYCPETDQLGTERPQGAACDIGAYELVANNH